MSWRVLKSVIKYSPQTSALMQEMFGDQVAWSTTDHLLAAIYDVEMLGVWLSSDTKRNKRPEPLQRPGQKSRSNDQALGSGAGVPASEFWEIWNSTSEPESVEGGVTDAG